MWFYVSLNNIYKSSVLSVHWLAGVCMGHVVLSSGSGVSDGYPLLYPSIQDDSSLPKGDLADQFKPVVPWPHVEGVEVNLNSIRLKHGETHFHFYKTPIKKLWSNIL